MNIVQVLAVIDELQDHVFTGRFSALPERFAALSDGLGSIYRQLPCRQESYFRKILRDLVQTYANRDYLLLADLLEFELKPLLIDATDGDEQDGKDGIG